ncbi:unnamed protein product [Lasius platythorax]|uniref:Uncharacterized protein n=1 Tax=Lasius platythorax TaxID=488582 RepID=A0AAV2P6Q5_9HYME
MHRVPDVAYGLSRHKRIPDSEAASPSRTTDRPSDCRLLYSSVCIPVPVLHADTLLVAPHALLTPDACSQMT